jgi:hypothetical protein
METPGTALLGNYFRDNVTFFANSLLPNFQGISICNNSDLIIAFDRPPQQPNCGGSNFPPCLLVQLH